MTEKEKKAKHYFDKAKKAYERKDYKTARKYCEKAIKLNPNAADAFYNLATILFQNFQEHNKAKQYYEKAIELEPNFVEAYNNLAVLLKDHFQEYKQAKQYYEKAIELDPNHAGAYNNLGNIFKNHFQKYEKAKQYYEKAIELKPKDADVYNNLALLLSDHFQEYKQAKQYYEKAIELEPNLAEAYYNFAKLLKEHFQEYEKAKQYYEKAIKLKPKDFKAYHNLAILLYEQFDDIENVYFHFLKAIEIGQEDFSRLELDKRFSSTEDTFIKELEIKKVRHLKNIDIKISDTEKKHLLFTGKNGSGKTSVLNEAKEYLEEMLEMPINKEFFIKTKQQFLSKDDYNLKFDLKSNLLTLRLKYETGNFIAAYFPARRNLNLKAIDGLPKSINIPLTAKISERLNDDLIDYYWNIKTQALLALEKKDIEKKKRFDNLINTFIEKIKIIDNRIKKVEFTADNGKYNIELIPNKPFEKFDFSKLADGYASIFDFISEIILRMSYRTDDVFNLEGIVLIDEPEIHLHIEMQKKVLPLLSEFFPRVQFIVATHSPFILNSVANAVVYDLETKIRTERLSNIPPNIINKDYLSLEKGKVNEYKKEIKEFIKLVKLLDDDKLTEEQSNRIAELDLKLNDIILSDDLFKEFKKAQKKLY